MEGDLYENDLYENDLVNEVNEVQLNLTTTYDSYIKSECSTKMIFTIKKFDKKFNCVDMTSDGNILNSLEFKGWDENNTEDDLKDHMLELSKTGNITIMTKTNPGKGNITSLYDMYDLFSDNTVVNDNVINDLHARIVAYNNKLIYEVWKGYTQYQIMVYQTGGQRLLYMFTIMFKMSHGYIQSEAIVFKASDVKYVFTLGDVL